MINKPIFAITSRAQFKYIIFDIISCTLHYLSVYCKLTIWLGFRWLHSSVATEAAPHRHCRIHGFESHSCFWVVHALTKPVPWHIVGKFMGWYKDDLSPQSKLWAVQILSPYIVYTAWPNLLSRPILSSLLRSSYQSRHATLLPLKWVGSLRDDLNNGCEGDYML